MNLEQQVIKDLKKEKTKIAKYILDLLNKEYFYIRFTYGFENKVYQFDGDIPNLAYNYLKKFIKKHYGLKYWFDNDDCKLNKFDLHQLKIDNIITDKYSIYIYLKGKTNGAISLQKNYFDNGISIFYDLKYNNSNYCICLDDEYFEYGGLPLFLIRKINKWFKDNGVDKTCKNILTKGY